ncbi:polysaccharide pyruvyl transferase family protein [Rhodococcus sp. NPDC057014]|uniref:polysaccharide pyruvyl transferase family protein n=1 Tax=Rhodococcus sp. NPDC057014 TaxID=3346000 RepID=UPI00363CC8BC
MRILIVSADRTLKTGVAQNLGDSLLTDALLSHLKSLGFDPVAADFGNVERVGSAPRVNVRRLSKLWRLIRTSDLVLIGGGTLLQDDQRARCFAGLPRLCLTVSVIGWLCNRRIVYFGVGCDPVSRPHMRNTLRMAVFGRKLFVRDEESLARVRTELNSNGQVACDASLLLYP